MSLASRMSLQRRLVVAVVGLLAICAAALAAVLAETYDRQLEALARDRLQRDLPLVQAQLEEYRLRDMHLAEVMAANPEVVSGTEAHDGAALARVLGPLHIQASPAVQTIAVVDPRGQIIAMDPFSDLSLGNDVPVRAALQGARDVNVSTTRNVLFWVRNTAPQLSVESAWPIRSGSGTLGALVTLNTVGDGNFETLLNPGHLQGAIFAPQQRTFLAGNTQLRQLSQQQKLPGLFEASGGTFYQQAVVGGEPYYFLSGTFPTQPVQSRLLLGVPSGQLTTAATTLRRQLAAVGTTALLVLAAFGWLVVRWLMRPVRQLGAGARHAGEAGATAELAKNAPVEVREVAAALSALAGELTSAVEAERGQRHYIEAIIDSMAEGVVISDANRHVTMVNPIGKRLLGMTEPRDGTLPGDLLVPSRTTPGDSSLDAQNDKGGSSNSQTIKSRSAPIIGEDGRTTGYVTLLHDASEEAELDRLKSEFVGIVSHELRTPLTSIKGSVDLLLDDEADALNSTQRRFLSTIRRSSDRLINLVNDLLDLSRLDAGRVQLDVHPVDARHVVEDTVRNLDNLFAGKRQQVQVSCEADVPPILADRQRIEQVLINLLGNASKYTPEGGQICVGATRIQNSKFKIQNHPEARPEDDVVQIAVSDTGPGLSPEDQEHVFEKFYRAGDSLTQQQTGSGLGLAIARSLVELHGGTLTVQSELGSGSTFQIRLPAYDGEE